MRQRLGLMASLMTLAVLLAGSASAQERALTGELTGTVGSDDGLSLPGATVTVSSPALLGTRTAVTDINGMYILRALPPGTYQVLIEFPGMRPIEDSATVPLGGTVTVNATLQLAGLEELVTVTSEIPAAIATTTTTANFTAETINTLPTGRTPGLIAELAPGLTANTPNVGQVTIAGAFAFDNVFLINGVDANDNLFGFSNNVFIEDAIAETTVLTSGISAEFGRFTGGIINIVTKSGGNDFSGSFRQSFRNPAWTKETPFEVAAGRTRDSDLNSHLEGTFGGPVLTDRAWFFTAGRYADTSRSAPLPETNAPFTETTTNKRYELKGTAVPAPNHTIQSTYINNGTEQHLVALPFSIDPNVAVTRTLPNDLFSVNWSGVVAGNYFATFQVSRKTFGFLNSGGTSTDLRDSPIFTRGVFGVPPTVHFNAPYFDATDPQNRDNLQFAGNLSYFLSTASAGSHDLKIGVDHFTSTLTGGNSQSATGFRFITDYLINPDGSPLIDANGRLVPRFDPGFTFFDNWRAVRGAQIDVRTLSFFAQDRWALNRHLSFDLGLRYENVRSEATGGIIGVDTDRWMPRAGASYDVRGDGRTVLQASYALYSGKYAENQIGRNTNVGTPDLVRYLYLGPAGTGRDFGPAYDLDNYAIVFGSFPLANRVIEPGLKSPAAQEFAVSIGQELQRGWVRATVTNRNWDSFIQQFVDDPSPSGKVTVVSDGITFGTFDVEYWRNDSESIRRYTGLQLQSAYRPTSRLNLNGHWTIQFRNEGNFAGEAANQPGLPTARGDRPEITALERNEPFGRLPGFQRHKVRLWAIYTQQMGRFGSLDVAPLVRIDSGEVYSLRAAGVPISQIQRDRNPGYQTLPGGGTQDLYFGDRGSQSFNGYGLVDLGLNYAVPVWRQVRPWMKVEFLNLFNNQKLIRWDATVVPDPNSPLDSHGLRTGYLEGPRFGEGTAATHYPGWRPGEDGGRTFLVAWGFSW